ncbi:MAG: helix-turn-helix transcriptional regulator [Clostridia bacterium]|nr:helix-turn-helix transcriptional regulator [Clostridia bacterium]
MDNITVLIKNEIKRQYKSVSRFSEASGIPYSTLSNALAKGVGGTSYDTVVKICRLLNIRQVYDGDLGLINNEFYDICSKLTQLDEQGAHTVRAVLGVEYDRCVRREDERQNASYGRIGYADRTKDGQSLNWEREDR